MKLSPSFKSDGAELRPTINIVRVVRACVKPAERTRSSTAALLSKVPLENTGHDAIGPSRERLALANGADTSVYEGRDGATLDDPSSSCLYDKCPPTQCDRKILPS
jgi:hypothetical protein